MAAALDGPDEDWDPSALVPGQDPMDCLLKRQQGTGSALESHTKDTRRDVRCPQSLPIAPPRAVNLDIEDDMAVRGVCGLANLGNTCFMNAGLQCLCSIPAFVKFFLENQIVGTVSEQKWEKHVEVAMSFTMLVNKLWAGVFSCIHPGIFHQTFGSLHKQFANYRQHDCQEFIAFLLDSLHEILTLNVLMRRQDYLTSLTLPEGNCGEDRMVVDDACEQSQLQDGMFKADSYRTENMGENEAKERIGAIEGCEEKGKREAKEGCEEKNTKISVITSTLQGTFKSLVECLACEHVSVTFEPFMYLSLPIPRAMERQIVVTFVPSMSLLPPIRYMVTVHKAHFVANLKTALIEMLPEDSKPDQKDVVLTEVYCWSIARILDDTFPLRFITSALRHLVAFEIIKMSSSQLQTAEMTDSCQNPVSLLKPSETETCEPKTDAECVITTADINPCETGNDCGDMNSNLDGETNNGNVPLRFDALNSTELLVPISSPVIVEQSTLSASSASLSTAMADIVVGLSASLAGSLWHTCAICLEEMLERELMTHPLCGCMLCQPCLEMTKNHHGGSTFICPVCLKAVDADAGFVCMSVGSQEREIRNLCIPVEFKQVSPEQEGSRLEQVNFVALLQLSSISTPQDLYQKVSEMLCQKIGNVNSLTFTVHVAYGLFSSYQSLIEQHPDVLSTGRDIVELRPSDTVCVVFSSSLTQEMKTKLCAVVDHCSVQSKISQTWTLADCLEAFIKSEELGDENTWFCPHCCANQKARKTLLLWKLPSTLIVHLKRFVFEGMCGEKIDVAVDCPLEQLDMSQYVIEDNHGCPLVYDLISYVCHSGGLNSGHYTAHVKSPLSGIWYYLNDKMAIPQQQPEAMADAYILFYQRKGSDCIIPERSRDEVLAESRNAEERYLSQQFAFQFGQHMSPQDIDIPKNSFDDSPSDCRTPPPQVSPLLPSTPVEDGGAFIPLEEAAVELRPMSRASHFPHQSDRSLNQDEREPLLGGTTWLSSETAHYNMDFRDYPSMEDISYFDPSNLNDVLLSSQNDVTTQWAIEQSYHTFALSERDGYKQPYCDNLSYEFSEEWSLLEEGSAWSGKQTSQLSRENSEIGDVGWMGSSSGDAQEHLWQLRDYQDHQ